MSSAFVIPLSEKARRREPSAIRELGKLLQHDPTILSLGAGTPNEGAVPLSSFQFKARVGGNCFETNTNAIDTVQLSEDESKLSVSYSPTPGIQPLLRRLRNMTIAEHQLSTSQSSDSRLSMMVGTGSQSLLAKGFDALCNPGDSVLVEEATYPGSLALLQAIGVRAVPVRSDTSGMDPAGLESVLSDWEHASAGAWDPTSDSKSSASVHPPKPRVIYLIPNGSNPTGTTIPADRRKVLYAIAQRHGLFIVEDDPYYWLRYPPPAGAAAATAGADAAAVPVAAPASGAGGTGTITEGAIHDGPLDALPPFLPSFLHLDVDGRVLRLDSFSKVIAGGLRMGFASGPARLLERMELDGQASDLHASGLSQACLCATLRVWGAGETCIVGGSSSTTSDDDSIAAVKAEAEAVVPPLRQIAHLGRFEEHVRHVAGLYRSRCATFLRHAMRLLPADMVTLDIPSAGMFCWIKTNLVDTQELVKIAAEKSKVLLLPGAVFMPKASDGSPSPSQFIRASFSKLDDKDTSEALQRLGACLRDFK